MTTSEVEPSRESELRNALAEKVKRRESLVKAGFKTCTHNGMLCRCAGELEQVDGKPVLKCAKYKQVTKELSDKCMSERLQPLPTLDPVCSVG